MKPMAENHRLGCTSAIPVKVGVSGSGSQQATLVEQTAKGRAQTLPAVLQRLHPRVAAGDYSAITRAARVSIPLQIDDGLRGNCPTGRQKASDNDS